MENNHKLGLLVSYYLSRFDENAYHYLGFGNQKETHIKIGEILVVKPHSVKNWRDEFDPLFGYRAGWHKRKMSPSRLRVAQAFEYLDEIQIRGIVLDILSGRIIKEPEEIEPLINLISDDKAVTKRPFIVRAITGRAAEEYFKKYYSDTHFPIAGELLDCRDLGCGYDFKIISGDKEVFIEVKGLVDIFGGLSFTDKEWRTAIEKQDEYILCVVKNAIKNPSLRFITNPAKVLNPNKNIYSTIQISWSVTQNQIE